MLYTCAHCSRQVSGICVAGYYPGGWWVEWLLCPNCGDGSVRTRDGSVYPVAPFGPDIEGLPKAAASAYKEARNCLSVGALTACELMCRTILMYVAVDKGAEENLTFVQYISFFQEKQLITLNMKPWVDVIRAHGGKSAHTLDTPDRGRAESTLMFTAELLRLIYEMEYMHQKYAKKP